MPKWGMTMTEGRVAARLESEGDRVEAGEPLFDVETDEIANGGEAARAGALRRLVVEGRSAACGALIAVPAEPDMPEAEIDAFLVDFAPSGRAEDGSGGLMARFVQAEGLAIAVVTAARPEDAPPIVRLHGFGSDAATWMSNHEALAQDRAVHAIGLPSHGACEVASESTSLDALSAVVEAVLEPVAPGPPHLVCHSLGGRIRLRLADTLGERVLTLELIAPAGLGPRLSEEFAPRFLDAARRRPMKAALAMLVAEEGAIGSDMVERALSVKRGDGVTEALRAIAAQAPSREGLAGAADELAGVSVHVLAILGAADRVLAPPDGALRLPGTGRMLQMERPGEVSAATLRDVREAS